MKDTAWSIALRVLARLSGWIAVPIIGGVFLGRWIDRRYDSEPWGFLVTIGACFLISMYGLIVNARKEFKKIESAAEAEKKNKDKTIK